MNMVRVVTFLSANPHDLCDRLQLMIQEKQGGNDTNRFDDEIVAITVEFSEYKCNIPTQDKNYN